MPWVPARASRPCPGEGYRAGCRGSDEFRRVGHCGCSRRFSGRSPSAGPDANGFGWWQRGERVWVVEASCGAAPATSKGEDSGCGLRPASARVRRPLSAGGTCAGYASALHDFSRVRRDVSANSRRPYPAGWGGLQGSARRAHAIAGRASAGGGLDAVRGLLGPASPLPGWRHITQIARSRHAGATGPERRCDSRSNSPRDGRAPPQGEVSCPSQGCAGGCRPRIPVRAGSAVASCSTSTDRGTGPWEVRLAGEVVAALTVGRPPRGCAHGASSRGASGLARGAQSTAGLVTAAAGALRRAGRSPPGRGAPSPVPTAPWTVAAPSRCSRAGLTDAHQWSIRPVLNP